MSPSTHAPAKTPRPSRIAVVVYALSGAIGVLGVFAAVQPGQPVGDLARPDVVVVVDVPVVVDSVSLDARTLVGVWRAGSDVVVLDAFGFGTSCVADMPTSFAWSVRGNDVVAVDGSVLGTVKSSTTLEVRGRAFHAVQDAVTGGAL